MQEHTSAPLPTPQFTVKPPDKIERYHGQSVTLNCSAKGHPVPSITWTKCKGDIPEGRSQVERGQLKINSLTAESALHEASSFMWRLRWN